MAKTDLQTLALLMSDYRKKLPSKYYRHVVSGEPYAVIHVEFREEDLAPLVSYRPVQDETGLVVFCRPMDEFLERFTPSFYKNPLDLRL